MRANNNARNESLDYLLNAAIASVSRLIHNGLHTKLKQLEELKDTKNSLPETDQSLASFMRQLITICLQYRFLPTKTRSAMSVLHRLNYSPKCFGLRQQLFGQIQLTYYGLQKFSEDEQNCMLHKPCSSKKIKPLQLTTHEIFHADIDLFTIEAKNSYKYTLDELMLLLKWHKPNKWIEFNYVISEDNTALFAFAEKSGHKYIIDTKPAKGAGEIVIRYNPETSTYELKHLNNKSGCYRPSHNYLNEFCAWFKVNGINTDRTEISKENVFKNYLLNRLMLR